MAGPNLMPVPWRTSYFCEKKLDCAGPRFHLGDPIRRAGDSGHSVSATIDARFRFLGVLRFLRALPPFPSSRSEGYSWPISLDAGGGEESGGGGRASRRWTESSCVFVATTAISVARSGCPIRKSYTSAAAADLPHSAWRASGWGGAPAAPGCDAASGGDAAAGGDAAGALPPPDDSTDAFEVLDDPAKLYSTS